MGNHLLIFLSLLTFSGVSIKVQAQRSFSSPFTQNLQNGTIETIDRTLQIDTNAVMLITQTKFGKDIQQFNVKEIEEKPGPAENKTIYKCVSMDGKFPTIFVLIEKENRVEEILVLQPATKNRAETTYKILVDEDKE